MDIFLKLRSDKNEMVNYISGKFVHVRCQYKDSIQENCQNMGPQQSKIDVSDIKETVFSRPKSD